MLRISLVGIFIFSCSILFARTQYDYKLVNLVKIEKMNFRKAENESNVFAEVTLPNCDKGGEPVLDIGDYYLGPDCFGGDKQYVKIRRTDSSWRVHIAYCYSNHLYDFNRTVRVFCRYPIRTVTDLLRHK